jgi:hypothetical protein
MHVDVVPKCSNKSKFYIHDNFFFYFHYSFENNYKCRCF